MPMTDWPEKHSSSLTIPFSLVLSLIVFAQQTEVGTELEYRSVISARHLISIVSVINNKNWMIDCSFKFFFFSYAPNSKWIGLWKYNPFMSIDVSLCMVWQMWLVANKKGFCMHSQHACWCQNIFGAYSGKVNF